MKQQAAQRRIIPSSQFEAIFHKLPDGIVICDHERKILRINAAALKLFEVPSESFCIRGILPALTSYLSTGS